MLYNRCHVSCYITYVMLYKICYVYNICDVMLYNMCHVMLYNISHVMLCNVCHVKLYNMCHVVNIIYVMLHITCVMLCYI